MKTDSEQLSIWLNAPHETPQLEFKLAERSFDHEKLYRYCVAIGNEGGGRLILGVTDLLPRIIKGTSCFPNTQKIAEEIFQNIGFRVDVAEISTSQGRVLVFTAPPRPKGTAFHYKGAYLMRSGESLVPMTEDRLRQIFGEGAPSWFDEPANGDLHESDLIELLDTQTYFELIRLPYPTSQASVVEKLVADGLVDRKQGQVRIRRIGALLIAKNLGAFEGLTRKAARVVVYAGVDKLSPKIDNTGRRGYAVGFQALINFVMSQLPQNEVIKDALRTSMTLLPVDSIRELIANALVHQDFSASGAGPMIEVYANRVEISNPGEPIIPVDRFIDGYNSRNEKLTDLMRIMKICEERSSGVDRVVTAVELFQLPAPEFLSSLGRTIVVAHGPKSFVDMTKDDKVRACYQHCVLKYVLRERMTNETLRLRFGLPKSKSSSISQIIASAVEAGGIKADEAVGGSKKYARYLPAWA
jgi:ATP-dependent DNA helicase RecG